MIYDHNEKKLCHGTFIPRSFQRIADIHECCVVNIPTTEGHSKDIARFFAYKLVLKVS